MEGRSAANVDYANPWHAPLIYITCLALKGIGLHGLSLENLEAGNMQIVCTFRPALPPPELSKVTVGLACRRSVVFGPCLLHGPQHT